MIADSANLSPQNAASLNSYSSTVAQCSTVFDCLGKPSEKKKLLVIVTDVSTIYAEVTDCPFQDYTPPHNHTQPTHGVFIINKFKTVSSRLIIKRPRE